MKTQRLVTILFAMSIIAAASSAVQAAEVLRPGEQSFETGHIVPYLARYKISVDQGGQVSNSVWKAHLQEADAKQKPALRHVWSLFFPQETIYDQIHVYRETFAPIQKYVLGMGNNHIIDFRGKGMHHTSIPFATVKAETKTYELEKPCFELGLSHLLLTCLPLEKGYEVTLAAVDSDPSPMIGQTLEQTFKVSGQETIKALDGKSYDCWIVETNMMGMAVSRWISMKAPYLIRESIGGHSKELMDVQVLAPAREVESDQ